MGVRLDRGDCGSSVGGYIDLPFFVYSEEHREVFASRRYIGTDPVLFRCYASSPLAAHACHIQYDLADCHSLTAPDKPFTPTCVCCELLHTP